MVFLQPALLWGALAVAIPVIIHFWYQKKGQTIAWAASQWLTDKTSLQHRGLRLDEILLLLLRCLMVILLVLLLSKPIAEWLNKDKTTSKVHLIQPDERLVSNFRFELEEALKKGEKVFWIGQETEQVKDLAILPKQYAQFLLLQNSISKAGSHGGELNLYINNTGSLANLPPIYTPESFKLHSIADSATVGKIPYLELGEGKKMFTDIKTGLLKTASDQTGSFTSEPVHKGKIKVLLDYKNPVEQQTVQASLLALEEIYGVPFALDLIKKTDIKYDWILLDQQIIAPDPRVLYVLSGDIRDKYLTDNVFQLQDSLRVPTSELVRNGQLPEWLGEAMVQFYKLKTTKNLLSQQQLNATFVKSKPVINQSSVKIHQWLLLLFVITLLIERWIALKKTVTQNYA
ncbi:BatA domain-containing protein [Dyadobacter psychrotolerans]|uniref:Aerotolerance regulator N-terminal domain-containing protein n=1 Tax=Dyadobacter psychrotolerans TaxID=2541721 RepID=A0A4R5E0R3_9BACT|nr:BatA domain-containing protein [Dyadobacter psychrotolerans]TDE18151.1 hypothetical protein E0F88_00990 [Dyadobacter psychrotolerans]